MAFATLKNLFRLNQRATPRHHNWREIHFGIRQCQHSLRMDYLVENRYPDVGEAKYNWLFENLPCKPETTGE